MWIVQTRQVKKNTAVHCTQHINTAVIIDFFKLNITYSKTSAVAIYEDIVIQAGIKGENTKLLQLMILFLYCA